MKKIKKDTLPFEKYIHSCEEKEYKVDIRKKNYIIKYASLLVNNPMDTVSLKRFSMNMIFFRNTFSKDACLYFFINDFGKREKRLLSSIVFDIFIKSQRGDIGEAKDFFNNSIEIYDLLERKHVINKKWEEIKKEFPQMI